MRDFLYVPFKDLHSCLLETKCCLTNTLLMDWGKCIDQNWWVSQLLVTTFHFLDSTCSWGTFLTQKHAVHYIEKYEKSALCATQSVRFLVHNTLQPIRVPPCLLPSSRPSVSVRTLTASIHQGNDTVQWYRKHTVTLQRERKVSLWQSEWSLNPPRSQGRGDGSLEDTTYNAAGVESSSYSINSKKSIKKS